ncbi:MAG: SulP family inorganic anion transporter, partial [Thermoguttaceae bacterium]
MSSKKSFRQWFHPQILSVIHEGYSLKLFSADLVAGIITGIVALPLAIAFGIASGVTPEQGVYTAVIGGFLISLFSGSRVQIGGPTGAFIIIVYGIVQKDGINGLWIATIMAGGLLILMGLSGVGKYIKYIPYPVTLGFTSGIAIYIAISQLQPFLGLDLAGKSMPPDIVRKLQIYWEFIATTNTWAVLMAIFTIIIIFVMPHVSKRIPGSLVAIVICTLITSIFQLPVDTIAQKVGHEPVPIQMGFPSF